MSIVITGATGNLGRLVIRALLDRGVEARSIVAAGRDPERLDAAAELGVRTAPIDYADAASLRAAFEGADRVLLISGSEVGQRVPQHRNAITAAVEAGVAQLAYTSILRADSSSLMLAEEHLATEEILRDSGLPFVLLRNGWYLENYTEQIPVYLQVGGVAGSAGDGRISGAARADFAEAAAAVLTGEGHDGAVYELGGDRAFTMAQVAAEVAEQTGTPLTYQDLPVEAYAEVLEGAGLPPELAAVLADGDRGVAADELYVDTGDLSRLIGRPTTPLADAVAAALSRTAPVA
ncbi:SDR family oxidoreductase [Nitriliruptor alkaliphilus]|uniref:SDR family oxidoreductase n=1 Tax=Nitriliruptor alkaliphilus TaxID=427918 RepID=UPI0006960C46|nr:SDR family oxidoreductase [Nitriliruptor alkaliphilus]